MTSIWRNGNLATMIEPHGYGTIEQGAIVTEHGKIVWLGPERELPPQFSTVAKSYDLAGHWVTPGLIDCHTHLVYAGNRVHDFDLRMQGVSYAEIAKRGGGIMSTVKATRAASEQELFSVSAKRLKKMMAKGVTTIEIKSGYGLNVTDEIKILKVAKKLAEEYPVTIRRTFLGAHTIPPEYKDQVDNYIDLICLKLIPELKAAELIDAVDVYCESIAFNLVQTEQIFMAAQEHGLAIKCHAEQLSDLGASYLAAKYKAISCDHLEYISEASIDAMAASGTVAVLLPGAFYFLREKNKPPVAKFRHAKVQMAVATDCNPGTSPTTSLPLIMNMGVILMGLTPCEVLHGVTSVAAKALGLENELGTLAVGKYADFAIWDIESPAQLAYDFGESQLVQLIRRGVEVSL